eukprot:4664514-Prymnesium_polylepis.1
MAGPEAEGQGQGGEGRELAQEDPRQEGDARGASDGRRGGGARAEGARREGGDERAVQRAAG